MELTPGKGAVWTTVDSEVKISEFSFEFDVKKGDSFNAAGFMFGVKEVGNTLEGYLFSINFDGEFLNEAGNKNGAIYKFKYTKEANAINFESLDIVGEGLDVPITGGEFSGRVTIKVTDSGYLFTSNFTDDILINSDTTNANSFGFFSDHYDHSCSRIGYFKLHNIKVTVTAR